VIAFTGTASLKVGAAAEGPVGTSSGSETIQLGRVMTQVHFLLVKRVHDKRLYSFAGGGTGGTVQVADSLDDTADDYHGDLKQYEAVRTGGAGATGFVVIDFETCEYKFALGVTTGGEYTGDPEVSPATVIVSFGAISGVHAMPQNLKLQGSDSPSTNPGACNVADIASAANCAYLSGGWLDDLVELDLCGNTDPGAPNVECQTYSPDMDLGTPASLSWQLTPIFEKVKKGRGKGKT
jgi:hypothetical protein